MLQIWNDRQQEGHLYPERFSRSCEKFSVSLFVISNPLVDGCLGNVADRRQCISNTAKAGQQESNKFLLLLDGKNIGSFFNFQERTQTKIVFPKLEFVESDCVLIIARDCSPL